MQILNVILKSLFSQSTIEFFTISKYRKYLSKYDDLYLSFRFWLLLFISGGSARFAYLVKLEKKPHEIVCKRKYTFDV